MSEKKKNSVNTKPDKKAGSVQPTGHKKKSKKKNSSAKKASVNYQLKTNQPAQKKNRRNSVSSRKSESNKKKKAVSKEETKAKQKDVSIRNSEDKQEEVKEPVHLEEQDVSKTSEKTEMKEETSDQQIITLEEEKEKNPSVSKDKTPSKITENKDQEEKKTSEEKLAESDSLTSKDVAKQSENKEIPSPRVVLTTEQVLKEAESSSKKLGRKNKIEDTIGLPVLDQIITPQDFVPQFEDEISGEKMSIPRFARYVHPLECMMKQAVSGIHDVPGRALFGIFMKYVYAGLGITLGAAHFLNLQPFSMARMTFSDGSWLCARIAVFGFLTEIICIVIKSISGDRKFVQNRYSRLRDIQAEAAPSIGIMGLISGILMIASSGIALIGWMITCSYAVAMRAYAFELAFKASRKKTLYAVILEALAAGILILLWYSLLGHDIARVMQSFYAF